jgi:ankyrin repeat protein
MDRVQITLSNVYQTDDFGNTDLHNAILEKNMIKVKHILRLLVDLNKTDVLNMQNKNGDTPLHLAVRNYPLHSIGNVLLGFGANPNIKNKDNEIVKIAETFKEYLSSTNLDVNIDNTYSSELTHLTILGSDTENSTFSPARNAMFPSHISIQEYEKPVLVTEEDASSVVNTEKNMNLKDKTVKSFIENLVKLK